MMKNGSPVEMAYIGNILTFLISVPFILQSVPDFNSIIGVILLGVFQLGASYILFFRSHKTCKCPRGYSYSSYRTLTESYLGIPICWRKPSGLALLGGIIVISSVVGRGIFVNFQ